MRRLLPGIVLLAALAACQGPPSSAYVAVQDGQAGTVPVGQNSVGEVCRRLDLGGGATDVYCGDWEEPSARVRPGGPDTGVDLALLANGEAGGAGWRSNIDARFACAPDVRPTTILGGARAVVLECRYRNGGFPQVAMVAAVGGRIWYADTIEAAFEVTQRTIAVLAGVATDTGGSASAAADPLLAARLAAHSYRANDLHEYQELMRQAADANRRGNASAAESAYRYVIALQDKLLEKINGQDNPDKATPLMYLALQLSDQGRFAEADVDFGRAAALIGPDGGDATVPPLGSDGTARARLYDHRGIDQMNRHRAQEALKLFEQSASAYLALAQPTLDAPAEGSLLPTDTTSLEALFGLVEVKRNRAWALRELGRLADSEAELRGAEALVAKLPRTANHFDERETAFVYRTHGLTLAGQGQVGDAIGLLQHADRDFSLGYGGETQARAETKLILAAQLLAQNRLDEALATCGEAVRYLSPKEGVVADLMAPCLEAYVAGARGAAAQQRLAEMFEAAERIRGTQTSQQIQQAARRMAEDTRDPAAAALIGQRDRADNRLQALDRQRTQLEQRGDPADAAKLDALRLDVEKARDEMLRLDEEVAAASPRYNQNVPMAVSAKDVMAALRPGEAFLLTVLSEKTGWSMLLRDGRISVGRIDGGSMRVDMLVKRLRHTLEPLDDDRLHPFDFDASHELYEAVLGPLAPQLQGVTTLTISPSGSLLALPFEVLLTAPWTSHDYSAAPWLVRQFAIAHVPEPGNFLGLRKLAGSSPAPQPWFGFGAATNVTLAQAEATFPAAKCHDAAAELAGLPRLDAFVGQLNAAADILGASRSNQLTGQAFTSSAVASLRLDQYKVLHFAAHGLLPSDLECQTEPAIVASAPVGAADAGDALLTSSKVEKLSLNADLVILSSCNSGGPGGNTAGEALSGLARSFFGAGARALLITHWKLFDVPGATLIPDALSSWRQHPDLGIAGGLREAQLHWLDTHPGVASHPSYWGVLAVIGDAGGPPVAPARTSTATLSYPG